MITTNINFPDGLPYALRDGYSIRHESPFIRTKMSSGRGRNRRAFTSVPSSVSVSWFFNNDSEAMLFESWFRDSLKDGTAWFNMPLKTPTGLKHYVCRFIEMYDGPNLVGVSAWRFTAQLEIFERPLMPPGWGNMPDFILHMSEFDVLMNKTWPEYKG